MEDNKALAIKEFPILEHEPQEVLEEVVKVSNALTDVVKKAGLSKRFGGDKEHLFYEAWQTVGGFFSHSVKTFSASPVEIDGIKGAWARAILYNKDGLEVGGAEAYCMRDEKNWEKKPFFQLASMAQTRAGSKAFRNKFAWVAVLGGYAGTPAEEMEGVHEGEHKIVEDAEEIPSPVHQDSPLPFEPTTINQVMKKTGEYKGNPWTKYTVHAANGAMYVTFDHNVGAIALDLKENQQPCTIIYEDTPKGKKITEIR